MNFRFSQWLGSCLLLCSVWGCIRPSKEKHNTAKEKFTEHVRTTAFRTPEEEKEGFTLPPGFEITLFAAEPDISKPINMEFDDRGRLWVSQSSEYPMAANPGKGKDRISILEDSDGDGKADKFTHFEDSLNIPIGIMPMADGAIAYNIPNLYRYTDADEDGKADGQKVLFGTFGHQDTHGMINNLIRGFDGWIYACHGFTNSSTIAGSDGDSITMVSGNTFRFRPDGSRVEQTSYGRVNPFGHAFDEWGYLYSADCHSKPIYQIIRGGDYPGFGKKASGIGFAPEMMHYELGSTAIAGLAYYMGEQFPAEYRNSFYSGDVVTCQVNRNTMTLKGTTPVTKREADFLVSDDPWFRPVDIKTGPDGALYVADFYNRIIGHYEVPLNHPGRDRVSGRIWKITYTGKEAHKTTPVKDWSKASLEELVAGLQHPLLPVRLKVADRLVDVWKDKAVQPVMSLLTASRTDNRAYIQALWILYRLHALPDSLLAQAAHHTDPMIRVHALRVLREMDTISIQQRTDLTAALHDQHPHVQRIAVEVTGRFTGMDHIVPLLDLYDHTSKEDSHLQYTILLALRDNLRQQRIMQQVAAAQWNEAQLQVLTKVMLDVPSPEAAAFVLNYLRHHEVPQDRLVPSLEYIGRYVAPARLDQAIALIRQRFAGNTDAQFDLYRIIRQGLAQRGAKTTAGMHQWGVQMAQQYLQHISETTDAWKHRPLAGMGDTVNPWRVSEAFLTDITPAFRIAFSERKGYPPTGVLYSVPFPLPAALSMNVFDNDVDNSPSKIGTSRNSVRVRLAGSDRVVAEYRLKMDRKAQPKDLIRKADFDLSSWKGQKGYIEVIDSTRTGSVGIGKLEPAALTMPARSPAEMAERRSLAADLAGELEVTALEPALRGLLTASWMDDQVRIAAAGALMNISPQRNAALLGTAFNTPGAGPLLREKLAVALGQAATPQVQNMLEKGLSGSTRNVQVVIATVLANSATGIDRLLQALKQGAVNADVVEEPSVKERLAANMRPAQQQQLAALTAGGADERAERQQLIAARLAGFASSKGTAEQGRNVFQQNCSMCHQIKSNGGLVGPQLDGIGNWGQKALTEKILDPNRNISEAFRNYNITLKNGKILSGLYRRTEGQVQVFADLSGKEFSVAQGDIREKKASRYTLMPDHFRKTVSEQDFYALLKFLLDTK